MVFLCREIGAPAEGEERAGGERAGTEEEACGREDPRMADDESRPGRQVELAHIKSIAPFFHTMNITIYDMITPPLYSEVKYRV